MLPTNGPASLSRRSKKSPRSSNQRRDQLLRTPPFLNIHPLCTSGSVSACFASSRLSRESCCWATAMRAPSLPGIAGSKRRQNWLLWPYDSAWRALTFRTVHSSVVSSRGSTFVDPSPVQPQPASQLAPVIQPGRQHCSTACFPCGLVRWMTAVCAPSR